MVVWGTVNWAWGGGAPRAGLLVGWSGIRGQVLMEYLQKTPRKARDPSRGSPAHGARDGGSGLDCALWSRGALFVRSLGRAEGERAGRRE